MIETSIDQITRVVTDFRRKPIVEIRRKWPEVMPARVRFSEYGVVAPLAAGAVVTWVLRRKTDGLVLSTPVAATLVGSGAASYYETLFYFSTDAMNPLFANTELRRLECVIEIRWEQSGSGTDQRSVTIPAIVERAENPGDLINAENVTGYPSAQVILDHISDDENPHAVTAAQVGAPTIEQMETADLAAIAEAVEQAATSAGVVPSTRVITAAGLATGGGDLSADRTITVSESGDTAVVDETESTTVISPRKWWQRLNFWLASTAAKTIGGNLTINGVDARLPNGGATFPTPESICTQARGDGRYIPRSVAEYGKQWIAVFTGGAGINASGGTASLTVLGASVNKTNATGSQAGFRSTLFQFIPVAPISPADVGRRVDFSTEFWVTFFIIRNTGEDGAVARFFIGKNIGGWTISEPTTTGIGLQLDFKTGGADDVIGYVRNADGADTVNMGVLTAGLPHSWRKISIHNKGTGEVDFYSNNIFQGSTLNGPTGANTNEVIMSLEISGTDGAIGKLDVTHASIYAP